MQEVFWVPNKKKRLPGDTRAREEELRERLEKERGSLSHSTSSSRCFCSACSRSGPCSYGVKLAAWQEVAVRGCKTSERMYEEARKRWEEKKEDNLPVKKGPYTGSSVLDMLQKRWEEEMEERKKELYLPVEEDFSVVCSNLDKALLEERMAKRGREVLAYEEWRKKRDEQCLSGWWGDWLREVGEPMEVEEEEQVDWVKILAPPPFLELPVVHKRCCCSSCRAADLPICGAAGSFYSYLL